MDPKYEDKSLQSDVAEILEEQDINEVYRRTMEILENSADIVPQGEEDEVLPAVHKYFGWEGYNSREAREVIEGHADMDYVPTEEAEQRYEEIHTYIQNVAEMLMATGRVVGDENLHAKLGMKDMDIKQVMTKSGSLLDMGTEFLKFYRRR